MTPARKRRATHLATHDMYNLNAACSLIRQAFRHPAFLVGSALDKGTYRDVDVRLILDDEEFDVLFTGDAARPRWELLSLAIGDYLRSRTGLPVDFQVQRMTEANAKHGGQRDALGVLRQYAGGGDATPNWSAE